MTPLRFVGHQRELLLFLCQQWFTLRKAEQTPLFAERKPVQRPGSRGGTGYYSERGEWVYGAPAVPEAPPPAPPPAAAPPPPPPPPDEPPVPPAGPQTSEEWEDAIDGLAKQLNVNRLLLYDANTVRTFTPAGPYARTPASVKRAYRFIKKHLGDEEASDDVARAWAEQLPLPPPPPPRDPQTTFDIPAENEVALVERLKKIAQRARRLGVEPPAVERLGETQEEIREEGEPTGRYRTTVHYQITGERPKLAGWEFWAAVQHEKNDDGTYLNLVNTVPGIDERLPLKYRETGPLCEHCQTTRRRKDTYIVRNVETGAFKQIGSDCLKDFTGHTSPEQVAAQAEMLADAFGALGESEEDGGWGGGGEKFSHVDTDQLLTLAAAVVRNHGYVSQQKADIERRQSTRAMLFDFLLPPTGREGEEVRKQREKLNIGPTDQEMARQTRAWAVEQHLGHGTDPRAAFDQMSDYEMNVHAALSRDLVSARNLAVAASSIQAYLRHQGRVAAYKKAAEESKHVGVPGERGHHNLTLVRVGTYEGNYGTVYPTDFVDEHGNRMTWWASTNPQSDRGGLNPPVEYEHQGLRLKPKPGSYVHYVPADSPAMTDFEYREPRTLTEQALAQLAERGEASIVPGTGPWQIGETRRVQATIKKHDVDRRTNVPVTVLTRVGPPKVEKPTRKQLAKGTGTLLLFGVG